MGDVGWEICNSKPLCFYMGWRCRHFHNYSAVPATTEGLLYWPSHSFYYRHSQAQAVSGFKILWFWFFLVHFSGVKGGDYLFQYICGGSPWESAVGDGVFN